MALVDAWRWWAKEQGLFRPVGARGSVLMADGAGLCLTGREIVPGDLLTMTLPDEDSGGRFNHIGFYLGLGEPEHVATGEGNRLNRTALGERPLSVVDGLIRLPG
ncbi:hypothetical protein JW859_06360 [bacterium]|nr:hypothetical protein [bacterium]